MSRFQKGDRSRGRGRGRDPARGGRGQDNGQPSMDNLSRVTAGISLSSTVAPSPSFMEGQPGSVDLPGPATGEFGTRNQRALSQQETQTTQQRRVIERLPDEYSMLAQYESAGHQPQQRREMEVLPDRYSILAAHAPPSMYGEQHQQAPVQQQTQAYAPPQTYTEPYQPESVQQQTQPAQQPREISVLPDRYSMLAAHAPGPAYEQPYQPAQASADARRPYQQQEHGYYGQETQQQQSQQSMEGASRLPSRGPGSRGGTSKTTRRLMLGAGIQPAQLPQESQNPTGPGTGGGSGRGGGPGSKGGTSQAKRNKTMAAGIEPPPMYGPPRPTGPRSRGGKPLRTLLPKRAMKIEENTQEFIVQEPGSGGEGLAGGESDMGGYVATASGSSGGPPVGPTGPQPQGAVAWGPSGWVMPDSGQGDTVGGAERAAAEPGGSGPPRGTGSMGPSGEGSGSERRRRPPKRGEEKKGSKSSGDKRRKK